MRNHCKKELGGEGGTTPDAQTAGESGGSQGLPARREAARNSAVSGGPLQMPRQPGRAEVLRGPPARREAARLAPSQVSSMGEAAPSHLGSRWLLSAMSHPHHVPASELGSETHTCSLNSAQLPRRRPEGEANQVNTHGLRTCPPTAQVHRGRWVVGNSSPGGVGFPTHRSTTASSKPDLSHSS